MVPFAKVWDGYFANGSVNARPRPSDACARETPPQARRGIAAAGGNGGVAARPRDRSRHPACSCSKAGRTRAGRRSGTGISARHVHRRQDTDSRAAHARAQSGGGGQSTAMITKNLSRRLERLAERLLPVLEEPLVIRIISVDGDGRQEDSGIRIQVQQVPKPLKKRRW